MTCTPTFVQSGRQIEAEREEKRREEEARKRQRQERKTANLKLLNDTLAAANLPAWDGMNWYDRQVSGPAG